MGSSTRSFFHFTGHRSQESFEGSSAGHTPFMNGTPSRTPLMTPVVTPRVEIEGMSWDTDPVPPAKSQKPTSKVLHGILKPRGPRKDDESPVAQMDHDRELHHHPSVCESCKQEIGVPLTPSASREISEAIARLQAEKMAAEVEASRSTDRPMTFRSILPGKSSAPAVHNKTEPVVKTPTKSGEQAAASTQENPRHVPTSLSSRSSASLASSVREPEVEELAQTQSLTRAAITTPMKAPEPSVPKIEPPRDAVVSKVPLDQTTRSRPFVGSNSGATSAQSMPALPTRSNPPSDQPSRFREIMSSETEETSLTVLPAEDTQSLAQPRPKTRHRWRHWMGLRKRKKYQQ
jgi:hypothetical protein